MCPEIWLHPCTHILMRDPCRTWHAHDPSRTRTCNLRVRRATPYPLGHRANSRRSDQHSLVLGRHENGIGPRVFRKTRETRRAPRSGHPVGRLVCSTALLHWNAQRCSVVIIFRWCVLQVGRDRDAHAVALCASGGRRLRRCVLHLG